MWPFSQLQRLLTDPGDVEGSSEPPDSVDSVATITIDDPEATSLRAIKLPDAERDACDATDRDR